MDRPKITILTFARVRKEFLDTIVLAVKQEFNCVVTLKEMHFDLSEFFDATRRQYNGDKLLKAVSAIDLPDSDKTIALFQVDLFIPILTYIFGQAQLHGHAGIASMYRLSNERYGIVNNDSILVQRFSKEVIHELGHLFGLIHCHTPACVMQSSTYVEDIDQKELQLCLKCKTDLEMVLKSVQL